MAKCTGMRCSMQVGYKVEECNHMDCPYRTEPMTNADRIRNMTNEELVVFLDGFSSQCIECAEYEKNESCPIYKEGHYCRPQEIMEWLQQPAKEDDYETG